MKIVLLDYGAGNVFSMKAALERLGMNPILTADKAEILSADKVVFPGVGHADFAMKSLIKTGIDAILPTLKQPVLGVCLGMQLMCTETEEGNVKGLSIFENVPVLKFTDVPTIPHMGWNNLEKTRGSLQAVNEDVYFVHSYYVPLNTFTIATANYGSDFTAAMEKDNFLACQFHPEKSGSTGAEVLKRFLAK
jgi:imidazole glycerol-phosphate synthase subunit HisH